MSAAADRNLLFGILALQMDFISREQLIAATSAWVLEKQTPLDEILVRQKALSAERRAMLAPLVNEHIKQHDDDPQKSLAAVSSIASVRDDLKQIADPEIEASLVHVSQDRRSGDGEADPYATRSVGESTSDGVRFRILRPHAKGGLGEVFVAEDGELHREVALKQIQSRHADDSNSRSRFMLEAEITGGLEHPGIVPVYGLGTYSDGRPFYAMRFIRGDSLKGAIERFHSAAAAKLTLGERTLQFRKLLGRFIDVCNAIDYAHSRGVLHRDLKPGNIMLGKYGETLVVDWGLAKALGKADQSNAAAEAPVQPSSGSGSAPTQMGSAIGTPQFMSPEQAEGRLDLLGPHSDVYSLGATLYCLLTGQPPLAGINDIGEVLRRVQAGDIPSPRDLKPLHAEIGITTFSPLNGMQRVIAAGAVPKGLDAICRKSMALKPADRYASPRALADDIEHWLADEPVSAMPDTVSARASRFFRRHRALVRSAAAALFLVAVVSTAAAILVNGARQVADRLANEQKESAAKNLALADRADKSARQAAHDLATSYLDRGWREMAFGRNDLAVAWFSHASQAAPKGDPLRASARALMASWVGRVGVKLIHESAVDKAEFSPNGKTVATIPRNGGGIFIWDLTTGRLERILASNRGSGIWKMSFSPDGNSIACAYAPSFSELETRCTVVVVDLATGTQKFPWREFGEDVTSIAFSPDGRVVAAAGTDGFVARTGIVKLYDPATGELKGKPIKDRSPFTAIQFSPNGKTVLTGGVDGVGRLWNVESGALVGEPLRHEQDISRVLFSPNGRTIATGTERSVRLWKADGGAPIAKIEPGGTIRDVTFSPDSRLLATLSENRARLWDASDGSLFLVPDETKDNTVGNPEATAIAFSPDGGSIAVAGPDSVQLLDIEYYRELGTLKPGSRVNQVAFSSDGRTIVTACEDGTARLWNTNTALGEPEWSSQEFDRTTVDWVGAVACSSTGNLLAAGDTVGTAFIFDVKTGKQLAGPFSHEGEIDSIEFAPNSKTVATGGADGCVRFWDVRGKGPCGVPLETHSPVLALAFSSDGQRMITGHEDNKARLWDIEHARTIATTLPHELPVKIAQFSEDGHTFLTGVQDQGVKKTSLALWDASGSLLKDLRPPGRTDLVPLALSEDAQRIVFACGDCALFWDAREGKPMCQPIKERFTAACVSHDGQTVAAITNGCLSFYDFATGSPLAQEISTSEFFGSNAPICSVCFSSDDNLILAGRKDSTVACWPIAAPLPDDPRLIKLWSEVRTGYRFDDDRVPVTVDPIAWLRDADELNHQAGTWMHWRPLEFDDSRGWNLAQAATFEDRGRWFAAAFHLKYLVEAEPANQELRDRLAVWEKRLAAEQARRIKSFGKDGRLVFDEWSYPADEKGQAGGFQKQGDEWVETKAGKPGNHFKESERTADYVELFDEGRKLWMRLTMTDSSFSRDHKTWSKLHNGSPAADDPPAAKSNVAPPNASPPTDPKSIATPATKSK